LEKRGVENFEFHYCSNSIVVFFSLFRVASALLFSP
jgi:hypothetical protein